MTNPSGKRRGDPALDTRQEHAQGRNGQRGTRALRTVFDLSSRQWRSLGRRFDYQEWPDRERFIVLDREIRDNPRLD